MSLFASPAIRVYNSENAESMVQRKPGANTLLPRKPFVDKTVNCNTPDTNRKQKSHLTIKEPTKATSPTIKTPTLEIDPEDRFSYREVEDQYEDLLSHFKSLETKDVYHILKNYLDGNTPPPSPTLPEKSFQVSELPVDSLESSFSSDKSYDEEMFFGVPKNNAFMMEPVSEIALPHFNVDDF